MEPIDPLLGPKLKAERAKRHLSDLESAMKAFVETNPYELVAEIDPHTSEEVYRIRIHRCIPHDFSIIAGDIAHNLRSALDQLICGLVRANRKQVSGGNGFPIKGSLKNFEKSRVGKLKNISPYADRFIGRLKPYKGGNALLWLLNELDIMDKHNEIAPVAAGQAQIQRQVGIPFVFMMPDGGMSLLGGPPGSVPFGFQYGFGIAEDAPVVELLHDNCEIYRAGSDFAHFPHNVQASIIVTFGKTKVTNNEPLIGTLKNLIQLVERTLNIVERRLL